MSTAFLSSQWYNMDFFLLEKNFKSITNNILLYNYKKKVEPQIESNFLSIFYNFLGHFFFYSKTQIKRNKIFWEQFEKIFLYIWKHEKELKKKRK